MSEGGANQGAPGPADEADVLDLFTRLGTDPQARDQLLMRFRPLSEYLARRFAGRGEDADDLAQVAGIGLLNAIDRFDPERGVRFSTYAAATIVGELKRHFRDKRWAVRVPRQLQETGLRINKTIPELTQQLGRSPTIGEIVDRVGSTREEVLEAMQAVEAYSSASLDAPLASSGLTAADTIGEDDRDIELLGEGWASVAEAIRELPTRDRRVLFLRFFQGKTQSEIAAEIGVSQMHVSRILASTLNTLREQVR
jgi:RNA polymerase sigma factor, sigma-70 family/RNA polymerase sigma-70 factor, sigma-B/F/G subfamily